MIYLLPGFNIMNVGSGTKLSSLSIATLIKDHIPSSSDIILSSTPYVGVILSIILTSWFLVLIYAFHLSDQIIAYVKSQTPKLRS